MRIVIEIKTGILQAVSSENKELEVVLIDHDVAETARYDNIKVNPKYIKNIFRKTQFERR